MVQISNRLNIPVIFFLLAYCFLSIFPASAENYPENFTTKAFYKVTYSGLVFAKIGVHFSQMPENYTATADIASAGLLKLFTKHSSHTTVKANGKNFTYGSIKYVSDYKTKNKKRHVDFTYVDGKFASENLVPPESATKRAPVALGLKNDSSDPLSGLIMARSKLRQALADGSSSFAVNIYDGRRLTKVDLTVAGKKVLKLYGAKQPVIIVNAKRTLVAGFSKDELEEHDANEPPLVMYFSDDATLFPIRLEYNMGIGILQMDLFARCNEKSSCLLGNVD